MLVYNYHPITNEYLGQFEADESPLEPGVFLVPANAATTPPPAAKDGFVRRFSGGVWGYSPVIEPQQEPTPEPVVTQAMVNIERDRRIILGSTFTVSGYGPVSITGRERDQIVLISRLVAAQSLKAAGVTAPSLIIRGSDNINHLLTPDQMIELVQLGAAWIEDVMKVSWDMKDATGAFPAGIPADYTNDIYWP